MPWIEGALALVVAASALWMLARRDGRRPHQRVYFMVAAAALIGQMSIIGLHWQVIPLYVAWLLVVVPWRSPRQSHASIAALLLCCASLAAMWALPLFNLPRPTGSYLVGTTGPLNWTDTSRALTGEENTSDARRELVVQVWYPVGSSWREGEKAMYARRSELGFARRYESLIRTNSILDAPIADAGAPFPVLLFGHRWAGSRTQDTFLIEELASHGYVVVAIDHPLNAARMLLSDGGVVQSDRTDALSNLAAKSAPQVEAKWAKELAIWTADDQFVLNQLQPDKLRAFDSKLDFSRVGAFGHSFGGASSMALLGVDPRVKCAVNLDGWVFQGLDHRTAQPILNIYEGASDVRRPETGVEGALDSFDNTAVDGSLARFGGLRAYVAGTQHLDFTDQTLLSPLQRITFTGPIAGERIRTITRGLVLGFFDRELKGTGEIPAYPEVKMQHFPAGR